MKSIKEIVVQSKSGDYKVEFVDDRVIETKINSIVIIDQKILKQGLSLFPNGIRYIPIEVSEKRKTYEECGKLIEKLIDIKVSRSTVIYAVGGGAIQDITTFVSAIYMRGLKWKYVPSTLMSMMDSCIGGKSSINFKETKNLIGNFNPPSEIFINTKLLATLNKLDFTSGLAEGYKIAFAKGTAEFLDFKDSVDKYRSLNETRYLDDAIAISLLAKKWFIEVDEFDKAERQLLNFGHSYGHALEASTEFLIPHGIAVLIGMGAALTRVGVNLEINKLFEVIAKEISYCLGFIPTIKIDQKKFLESLEKDKKNSEGVQRLILPSETGELRVAEIVMNRENLLLCLSNLECILNILEIPYEIF